MSKNEHHVTASRALQFVRETKLRGFTTTDWQAFAGCETAAPMIGEFDDYTVIVDGDSITILHADDEFGGQMFTVKGE